ncbi:MAG TPA: 16S rRNA (guanine(527)-N(7))-methyltransferase RsmG [Candidatus Polarisedimenticolia bacterium]|nr:16S rRNA (guanine(527)-N(7))-methyltransferase RsmG [Candidatus Polarisedimenticolia bacterium]
MQNLTDELIGDALKPYAVRADHDLCQKIRAYIATLLLWNRRISLTTVTEPLEILRFHFGESFLAASIVPIREGRLADVGSGAGFPGIPLRLLSPSLSLTLIEANSKKCAFLSEIVRDVGIDHVSVVNSRMEDFPKAARGFDFITARALGQHSELMAWSIEHLGPGGKLVLWLGEDDTTQISLTPGWLWASPILIPGSKGRFILAGSPTR